MWKSHKSVLLQKYVEIAQECSFATNGICDVYGKQANVINWRKSLAVSMGIPGTGALDALEVFFCVKYKMPCHR